MTGLTRWDPFAEMARFHDEVNRLFTSDGLVSARAPARFVPPVDVFEDEAGLTVSAELPGIKPEEVEVTVEDGRLSIAGERKLQHEEEKDKYRRLERSHGSFLRTFTLPRDVDVEKIRAEHRDGVLEIFVPRKEEARPRKIAVKAH